LRKYIEPRASLNPRSRGDNKIKKKEEKGMKKKLGIIFMAVVLTLALALPTAAVAAHTEGDPLVQTLYAGQDIDVGTVSVWNDGSNLYVKYETTGGWEMTETHLAVETGEVDIPQTKKGNPIPGHFAYSTDHDPPVTVYQETIDITGYTVGDELIIAAHAVVEKVTVMQSAPYYATTVEGYGQGTLNTGNPIPASWNRSDPTAILALNDPLWFFSLGFGESGNGWITVEFDCPIINGDGNDVQILEVTNASPYPSETANVYASQDGSGGSWIHLGQADNSGQAYPVGLTASEFDLGSLPWAKYIRVVDTTDPIDHEGITSDAFDLEAIVSLQDCIEIMEETAWADGTRFVQKGNWATYFTYEVQQHALIGDWLLSVNGGTYLHDMFILSVDSSGNITGTGGYPSSGPPYLPGFDWTLTGTITGTSISMALLYQNTYTATITGTVAGDWNSMSGGAGTGGVTDWTATRVP